MHCVRADADEQAVTVEQTFVELNRGGMMANCGCYRIAYNNKKFEWERAGRGEMEVCLVWKMRDEARCSKNVERGR